MKAIETQPRNALFAGVLDVIAESLGRPPARAATRPAHAAVAVAHTTNASPAAQPPVTPVHRGWLARTGTRLWYRRLRGVDAYIARADGMFAALDRWLWKQRMRETEAWLAQSQDVFELEARIRELERGPNSRLF